MFLMNMPLPMLNPSREGLSAIYSQLRMHHLATPPARLRREPPLHSSHALNSRSNTLSPEEVNVSKLLHLINVTS